MQSLTAQSLARRAPGTNSDHSSARPGSTAVDVVNRERSSLLRTLRSFSVGSREIAQQQGLSSALTFWSKANRDPFALSRWIDFIVDHCKTRTGEMPRARLIRKPQRQYGLFGRSVAKRVEALIQHHKLAAQMLDRTVCQMLMNGTLVNLARLDGRQATFTIGLAAADAWGQKQEGEWTLVVRDQNGLALARAAFSIGLDVEGRKCVLIGGLQGLEAGTDKSILVRATRQLSGLRPKDAALVGVQAVAAALGIERVQAVSNCTHVSSGEWTSGAPSKRCDYDAFWIERTGVPLPGIGFELPLPDYAQRIANVREPRILDRHRASIMTQVAATLARVN